MTLTQLEYIISLDEHRNFVKASKACFVTQPTLSIQVQKLEDLLQVVIFDRSKQPIEPTILGEKIISKARDVIRDTKSIDELILNEKGIVEGEFKLGIIPSVAGSLIPIFLKSFSEKFPNVKLSLIELKTEELIEKIKTDQIDGGIAATPLADKDLTETPLYWEPFYIFMNGKNSLFDKEIVSQKDIINQNLLLMSEGNCFRTQVSQICKLKKSFVNSKNIEFESGNFQTIIQLVKQNMGITLLPKLVIDSYKLNPKMVKALEGPPPTREIAFITRRTLVKKTISDALIGIIEKKIPTELTVKKEYNIISPI